MWLYIVVGIPALLFILWKIVGFYLNGNDGFWPSRGAATVFKSEMKGGLGTLFKKITPMHPDVDNFVYNRFPDVPFVGGMDFRTPILYIRDPELVKKITVKDFDHFVNRRLFNFGGDLSDSILFNMHGSHWKDMRAKMGPTFTSGKMRRMFDLFEKSSKDLADFVSRKSKNQGADQVVIGTKELYSRFAMDVIGSVAFGVDGQCLKDDQSHFYQMGTQFQTIDFFRGIRMLLVFMIPKLAVLLNISALPTKATNVLTGIITRALATRRENYSQNKDKGQGQGQPSDFVQLMVETQNAKLKDNDENEQADDLTEFERDAKVTSSSKDVQITDRFVVANALTFFIGGLDGTEAILSVATYHLAVYPEIQAKLRAEIDKVTREFKGQITYDSVAKMQYLDMFLSECFRKYPSATRFERMTTKAYTIPATESTPAVTIPVGTLCIFPVLAFHRDPKYYPNPEKFDPERFSKQNKAARHPYVYMPFGLGPRSCIAMRFVLTEVKAAVAHLVQNFEIRTCPETIIPLKTTILPGQYRPDPSLKVALAKRR